MSIEAMTIALHHSQASGVAKLVMIGIANHDGDAGSWPTVKTLARYANASTRTVQRAISELESLGEIVVHQNEGGTHKHRDNRRPNLYEFTLSCPAHCDGSTNHRLVPDEPTVDENPWGDTVVTPSSVDSFSRGDTRDQLGVTTVSPKPSFKPSNSSKGVKSPKRAQEKTPPDLTSTQTELVAVPLRPDRCSGHQELDIVPPCGGCAAARRQVESQAAEAQASAQKRLQRDSEQRRASERAARRAAIDACTLCDSSGYDRGRPCRHDPDVEQRYERGMAQVQAALEKVRRKPQSQLGTSVDRASSPGKSA